jgi:hypothetical protein
MDNSQSVQQEPEEPKDGNLEVVKSKTIPRPWLKNYFLLLLSGMVGISVTVSVFAYYQLIEIGDVPPTKPEKIKRATPKVQTPLPPDSTNPLPVWMVIAIALCCSTGCLVIFRLLKLPKQV